MSIICLPSPAIPRRTSAIIYLIEESVGTSFSDRIDEGLPDGSRYLASQQLAIGGTACDLGVYIAAMSRVAAKHDVDVVISRHGRFPELLNPVLWDAAVRVDGSVVMLKDLLLFADGADKYWLIPSRWGACVRIARDGLHLSTELPFSTWAERGDGLCLAAKRIVKATQPGRGR